MRKRQGYNAMLSHIGTVDVPPPVRDQTALDAWTTAFYRSRFDERLARIDAAIDASRMSLAGAKLRNLPSAGLGVLAGALFGAWLGKPRG